MKTRLYCFSEERANKERGIVERFAQRFETALTKLSDGLARPRTRKRVDHVWERIGRLKASNRRVAQHYDVELDTDQTGERATAVRFTRRPVEGSMMTHPGVYCLRTNETDWDEENLVADLRHPHRPRSGLPLAEIGARTAPPSSTTSPSAPKDICSSPSSPTSSCR